MLDQSRSENSKHILFSKVTKTFDGATQILAPISLEIKRGEFVALLGPSGCGKSTLLRMVAGLTPISSGEFKVTSTKSYDCGFVFQEAHLMPWRNTLDNITLPLELLGEGSELRRQKAKELLHLVGLENAENLYPNELSGGMKMRTSLARALIGKPNLLLLDEPFSALDETTRFFLAEELRRIWLKLAPTILFVTHSLAEATIMADRILVIGGKPGKIAADLKVELPKERTTALRTTENYARALKVVTDAFHLATEADPR